MSFRNLTVAVDGPASSGKSTVAIQIAEYYKLIYVDTGAMYRSLTYIALKENINIEDEAALMNLLEKIEIYFERTDKSQLVFINEEDVTYAIRQNDVTNAVSAVSSHLAVRREMVQRQQKIARSQGVVMDGRDIGTVVLPEADVKIFLVASVEERAKRRHIENKEKNIESNLSQLKEEIAERDYKDSNREISPLKKAGDATQIDTTRLTIREVGERIKEIIDQECKNGT